MCGAQEAPYLTMARLGCGSFGSRDGATVGSVYPLSFPRDLVESPFNQLNFVEVSMYTIRNFKTKKALKEAIDKGG